jgi:hypothetical protein
MKDRLQEIIAYKTGGKQTPFAAMLGWSPQYLAKLLKGENFGLQPILTILSAFPEINARWMLFGTGNMIEDSRAHEIRKSVLSEIEVLFDIEKYIPFMGAAELRDLEAAVMSGHKPVFSRSTLSKWKRQANDRDSLLESKFTEANRKSDESCKQRIAKK